MRLFAAGGVLCVATVVLYGVGSWERQPVVNAAEPMAVASSENEKKQTADQGVRPATELRVPDGFEATVYATDALVHNAYCMTLDTQDRVVVSAPGYVRVLVDRDQDGDADEAVTFADGPTSGAQGLCFDGNDLLAVGDGGLLRYRDADGDQNADGPPRLLLKLKTGGEHHAHAIRQGPDGWWYLICGNDTGISARDITSSNSAVAEPTAGTLLRFRFDETTGDVRDLSVVADGMRNAYDFDFTAAGDAVTYDSDDEREVSLPWYRPTRVFRLTPGSNAGWFSRSWKRPDGYPSMPQVLASLGRGSPTGVAVCRGARLSARVPQRRRRLRLDVRSCDRDSTRCRRATGRTDRTRARSWHRRLRSHGFGVRFARRSLHQRRRPRHDGDGVSCSLRRHRKDSGTGRPWIGSHEQRRSALLSTS